MVGVQYISTKDVSGVGSYSYQLIRVPVYTLIPSFNLLTPNVNYSGRIAPLTSEVAFYIFIQQI